MAALDNVHVAILATDGFEEAELTEPAKAFKDAGAKVVLSRPRAGRSRRSSTMTRALRCRWS